GWLETAGLVEFGAVSAKVLGTWEEVHALWGGVLVGGGHGAGVGFPVPVLEHRGGLVLWVVEDHGGASAFKDKGPGSYYDDNLVGVGSLLARAVILALFEGLFDVPVGQHRQDDGDGEDDGAAAPADGIAVSEFEVVDE